MKKPAFSIAVLPGDGIGVEVIAAGLKALEVLAQRDRGFKLKVEHFPWSSDYYKKHGHYIPEGGLERLKQFDAARQSFQAALAISPGAHSATMALASMLFQLDQRAEADRIVTAMMALDRPAIDPWLLYWPGDFRFGPARMAAMREALK